MSLSLWDLPLTLDAADRSCGEWPTLGPNVPCGNAVQSHAVTGNG